MKELALLKIFEIEKDLWEHKENQSLSLFTGISGLPVFYYMLYVLTKKKEYLDKIYATLEDVFNIINGDDDYSMTYCNGLSGVALVFEFLLKKEFLTIEVKNDLEEALDYIDEVIIKFVQNNTKQYEDIDFLHGAFGVGFYLNERLKRKKTSSFKDQIAHIFNLLADIVIEDVEKSFLEINSRNSEETNSHSTNCGLAHGHVSHIIIFSEYLKNDPQNSKVIQALEKSFTCLLEFKSTTSDSFSVFPSIAVNQKSAVYKIPLGWCYGDQTISIGLYKASQVINDSKIKLVAIEIAQKTLERDTIETIFPIPLFDSGFCHGLSSIAFVHKKWFEILEDSRFEIAYLKFIDMILKDSKTNVGFGGYQKHMGNNKYVDSYGLLDGSLGIGVVLIDYLLGENDTGWENFFLLK